MPTPDPEPHLAPAQPAGFWLRFLARFTDLMVMNFAVFAVAVVIALGHTYGLPGGVMFICWVLISFVLQVFYLSYYNSGGRQTIGYCLAGIRVQDSNECPISWQRSLSRTLWMVVLGLPVINLVDCAPVALSRAQRAVHDMLTATYVSRIAPPKMTALVIGGIMSFIPLLLIKVSLFPLQAYYIPAGSMEPTFLINDRLLVNKLCYHWRAPRFGDLVIFRAPPAALQMSDSAADSDIDFIKRCVGTPGDVVYAKSRKYYRNGHVIDEPYVKWAGGAVPPYDMKIVDGKIYYRDSQAANGPGLWMREQEPVEPGEAQRVAHAPPGQVPPGQFLMLGDHRSNSLDSHFWGFVPRANLVGKVMVIFWPLARAKGF